MDTGLRRYDGVNREIFKCKGYQEHNGYRPGITHKNFLIFAGPDVGMTMWMDFYFQDIEKMYYLRYNSV